MSGFKRYLTYKESGVEWIGEIPAGWLFLRLKHVAAKERFAIVDGPFGTQLKAEEYCDEGIPLIRITNLGFDGVLKKEKLVFISEEKARELTRSSIKINDLVIAKTGATIGKTGINKDIDFGVIASSCLKVSPNVDIINPDFLKYFSGSKNFQEAIFLTSSGSTRDTINIEPMSNLEICVPCIDDQLKIFAFLDRKTAQIDRLIEIKRRQIELLKEERTAVINQTVTKGLNPGVKMKESGIEWIGEIPEGWKIKRIKFLCQIQRGQFSHRPRNDPKFYDGDYPFIQTGDVARAKKYVTEYSQTLNEKGYSVSKEFPQGTLVMTIAANIGDVAILEFNACFPDSIVGLIPYENVDCNYLYYLLYSLRSELIKSAIENTQLNLNIERIGQQEAICPPCEEQIKIATYLDNHNEKFQESLTQAEKQIKLLQEYRTTLISDAVTGKIDVREEAA